MALWRHFKATQRSYGWNEVINDYSLQCQEDFSSGTSMMEMQTSCMNTLVSISMGRNIDPEGDGDAI